MQSGWRLFSFFLGSPYSSFGAFLQNGSRTGAHTFPKFWNDLSQGVVSRFYLIIGALSLGLGLAIAIQLYFR
jgi:hypothetical protein